MNPKSSSSADDVLEVRGLSADAATASESAGPDVASPAAAPSAAALTSTEAPAWLPPALVLLLLLGLAALWLGWSGREQTQGLEREIVRRVQTGTEHADEARLLAKQAVEANRETAAKLALLDARLAEVALQRSQLEELIQQLSRSRDENAVADIDAALRVAVQQSIITGSAEPLVAALRSADERLARINQPRLQGVRRALARDIDKVRGAGGPELASLLIRFDEAVRLVDELPLHSNALAVARANAAAASRAAGSAASSPASAAGGLGVWADRLGLPLGKVWDALADLVRVRRIDQPEAMLLAPEQAYFLRENIKLRLLNARLALLSRQTEVAQNDISAVMAAVGTYFDPVAKRTQVAQELLKQVQAQTRQVNLPRPDETLAAIAAALAGR